MVVAIDASRLEPHQKTGVEYYSYYLIQHLKKVIPPGEKVILYSRIPVAGILEGLPVNWQNKVLAWPLKYFWSQLRLVLEVRKDKPDILFIPSHILPFLYRGKTVVTIHDISWLKSPASYSWHSRSYLRLATGWIARHATAIITISQYCKIELERHYSDLSNKIFVTYLGPTIKPQQAPGGTKNYFICLGRVENKKNLLVILEAFARLLINNPSEETKLLLIGPTGVGSDKIIRRLGKSDLNGKVIRLPWQSEQKVSEYLGRCIALLFPGKYEGFGLPVLDAWAHQLPVVAAASGALLEVVGEAGILVNGDDADSWRQAMQKLLADVNLQKHLVTLGNKRLLLFSWQATAVATWQVLKLIMSSPSDRLRVPTGSLLPDD
ncbi:MAG: glycosyltransferase family 1 protein [Patescibacteria group bacterium]